MIIQKSYREKSVDLKPCFWPVFWRARTCFITATLLNTIQQLTDVHFIILFLSLLSLILSKWAGLFTNSNKGLRFGISMDIEYMDIMTAEKLSSI